MIEYLKTINVVSISQDKLLYEMVEHGIVETDSLANMCFCTEHRSDELDLNRFMVEVDVFDELFVSSLSKLDVTKSLKGASVNIVAHICSPNHLFYPKEFAANRKIS